MLSTLRWINTNMTLGFILDHNIRANAIDEKATRIYFTIRNSEFNYINDHVPLYGRAYQPAISQSTAQ